MTKAEAMSILDEEVENIEEDVVEMSDEHFLDRTGVQAMVRNNLVATRDRLLQVVEYLEKMLDERAG